MRRLTVAYVVLALSLGPGGTLAGEEEEPPATGAFSSTGSLARKRVEHTATLLPDGRVLVVGGRGGSPTSAEVWDPATGTFGPAGSLAKKRVEHTATLLPDGRVLIVGGWGFYDVFASATVWDPATASFSPAGSLVEARRQHTATLLPDGRILIVGGQDDDDVLASAEVWDPVTASFGPAGPLAEARGYHTATLLSDGRVLVVGGASDDGFRTPAEVWDPATDTFGPAGSLAEARFLHTATALPDGRVLVVGGWFGDITSAEVWEPATGTFGPAGSLAEARGQHTATLLPDGRVLVVGGGDGHDVLTSAEVWDPTAGTFGPAGSLAEPRAVHTATLLLDGRVLIVGGWGDDDILASAEVWDPGDAGLIVAQPPGPGAAATASSASPDGDLAESFPISVQGQPSEIEAWNGSEWVGRYDPETPDGATAIERTEVFVTALDATLEELTIATTLVEPSPDNYVTIAAARVAGVDEYDLFAPVIEFMLGDVSSPALRWSSIAGKWVISVRDASLRGVYPTTVYLSADTVWLVQADRPVLDGILATLPPATTAGRVDVPEAGITVTFPVDWTVDIVNEPSSIPAAPDRTSTTLETWRVLDASAPDGRSERCGVDLFGPDKLTADGFVGRFQDWIRDPWVDSVEVSTVNLPSGDSVRVQVAGKTSDASTFSLVEHHMDSYLLDSGDGTFVLSCHGEDPPDDDWLSIAENFEFLSAEE